ncbi:C1 family peptidase [Desulfovibrio inopinatus]|uniref:C1 family peptidase n=1 Tax=Desulfovibrio inopinatus TaxID=102109 RepID=UPI00041DF685|nr:C1 family peptidase [Desulfovibrio inopinatus]
MGSVTRDSVDFRDCIYSPALRPLKRIYFPVESSIPSDVLSSIVRTQGSDGSCTGQALATLIDILRYQENGHSKSQVSARMLFEMAKHMVVGERGPRSGGEIYSLRTVIKGFYHNGVCLDNEWPYISGDSCGELTLERSRAARNTTLGAYYRVRPQLNDFHAAINEVGALYVSAAIHEGWRKEVVEENNGHILPAVGQNSGHAFVIVGYTAEGFLVLNSWGKEWGGFEGMPGMALWRYQDWADSIYDAWVLRLAVPTPEAFDYSVSEQGLGFRGLSLQASTPRIEVLGHYQHLDDGQRVVSGTYPSPKASFEETVTYLAGGHYDHLLLVFGHGQEELSKAVTRVARDKMMWKREGVYPLSLLWANDLLSSALCCFQSVAEDVTLRGDQDRQNLTWTISKMLKGVGRALCRDLVRASRSAASQDGAAREIVESLITLCLTKDIQLHVLAEGEGALLLAELLEVMESNETHALFDVTETLTLVSPGIVRSVEQVYAPFLSALQQKGDRHGLHRAVLYRPSADLEHVMTTGGYPGSWLDFISAFITSDEGETVRLLGQAGEKTDSGWHIVEIQATQLCTGWQPSTVLFGHQEILDGVARRIVGKEYQS